MSLPSSNGEYSLAYFTKNRVGTEGLLTVETCDEKESIAVAMLEILDQKPGQIRKVELAEEQTGPGLQRWLDFVSGRIHDLRKKANLTQEELAERAGLPQSHISRLESAKHSPNRATLEKIAQALRVEVSMFDPAA